ncbi:MAG TPA: hypothetical protein VJN64_11335 [Terriglobales bacterium]|nr:hypothetical protein [Terriglobales bacterium]
MAGYSGTPLIHKIGIKPGHRVLLQNQPEGLLKELGPLPTGAHASQALTGKAGVMLAFAESRAELARNFEKWSRRIEPDGMLWIGWPKKASGRTTDLTENIVREIGLECGLVDIKVCAIDETWSGLKFVVRVKDRPAKPAAKGKAAGARK